MKNKILSLLTKEQRKLVKGLSIKKGATLFHEGDKCTSIGIVVSGTIQILSYNYEGNELIFNSLSSGDIFGNNLIFSSNPIYLGDVVSKEDSVVAVIEKDNLINILQTNQEFLLAYLSYTSDFTKNLNANIKMLSFDGAYERFMFYLQVNGGSVTYTTVTNLASTLHLQRETLSRLLSKLDKEKKILRLKDSIMLL